MARPPRHLLLGVVLGFAGFSCDHPTAPAPAVSADLAEQPAPVVAPPPPPPLSGALGMMRQPAPPRPNEAVTAVYEIGPLPVRTIDLRPGPDEDRQLVEIYCVGCHSTSYIVMQPPLPKATWEAEVQKMRSAFGAVIPDPTATRIATYLSAYYGPNPLSKPAATKKN